MMQMCTLLMSMLVTWKTSALGDESFSQRVAKYYKDPLMPPFWWWSDQRIQAARALSKNQMNIMISFMPLSGDIMPVSGNEVQDRVMDIAFQLDRAKSKAEAFVPLLSAVAERNFLLNILHEDRRWYDKQVLIGGENATPFFDERVGESIRGIMCLDNLFNKFDADSQFPRLTIFFP